MDIITILGRNQETILYLQELASTLLMQKLSQAHLTDNTSLDYQGFQRFLSIYKFPLTISYQLLFTTGHHVLHWVVIGINTIHLLEVPLLEDNSLRQLEELLLV